MNRIHTCCEHTTRKRDFNGDFVQYKNKGNFCAKKKRDGKKPVALMCLNDKLDCLRDGTGAVPYDGV